MDKKPIADGCYPVTLNLLHLESELKSDAPTVVDALLERSDLYMIAVVVENPVGGNVGANDIRVRGVITICESGGGNSHKRQSSQSRKTSNKNLLQIYKSPRQPKIYG